MVNNEFTNINYERAVEICVEKYFKNAQKPIAIKDNFVQVIKTHIEDYGNYQHYYPMFLHWILTSECNLRCKHCLYRDDIDKYNSKDDLSQERIMKLIDEIADMDIIRVTLTGGEIFLIENIFEILSKLKSKNIALALLTNATLITDEVVNQLKNILNPKIDIFQISLDGATRETHEKTRGKNTFDKTITGIKNLVNAEFSVFLTCVATNYNISELSEVYQLAKALKVKNLSIDKFTPFDECHENLVPSIDSLFYSISKVLECENNAENSNFRMGVFSFYDLIKHDKAKKFIPKYNNSINDNNSDENYLCHHHDKISLAANGDVYLCPKAIDYNVGCLGNIKDNALQNVWKKRHGNVLFQKRKISTSICKKCDYFKKICNGGCPISAYLKYGDIHAPDESCILGEKLMKNKTIINK